MDRVVDFLFNPDTLTQIQDDGTLTYTQAAAGIQSRPCFQNVHNDTINFAASSFSIFTVRQVISSGSQDRVAFPSRKQVAKSHLAAVSRICLVAEWCSDWFLGRDTAEYVCDLLVYDGFDYHFIKVLPDQVAPDKATVYKVLAFGALTNCHTKFVTVDEQNTTIHIIVDGVSVLRTTLHKCPEHSSDISIPSRYEAPGKIVVLAYKHQVTSWNLNVRLLEGLSHVSKSVDEVESAAQRSVQRWQDERLQLLQTATKLINTKKEEIARLQQALAELTDDARGERAFEVQIKSSNDSDVLVAKRHIKAKAKTKTRPKSKAKPKVKAKAKAKLCSRHEEEIPSTQEQQLAMDDSPSESVPQSPADSSPDHPTSTNDEGRPIPGQDDLFAGWGDD